MLTIYTPTITNRVRYILDLFFTEQLRVDHVLTDDLVEFHAADSPKFAYNKKLIPSVLCFGSAGLLFEKGVTAQNIDVTEHNYLKIFYQTPGEGLAMPFDPFAAAFYLVSRYEEYLPHRSDIHGRFPATESLAYKNDFLKVPLVNYYINAVKTRLLEEFPDMKFHPRKFKYVPTYDIDSAYAYKNKGIIRNIGGLAKAAVKVDLKLMMSRVRVMAGLEQDPYDTYDYLRGLHEKYKRKPIFFFLLGDYDAFDKNISVMIPEFRSLIKSIADEAEVGIHPSYASNTNPTKLKKEIKRLSRILRQDIKLSRQHFLMLRFPHTYNGLLENDIVEDYSMGYASQLGFRASICSSFYFYSLEQENKTPLKVYPFAMMDATLNYYLKMSPEEAIEELTPIIDEVKSLDGLFISLWHNNSLSETQEWVGWRKVFESMLSMIHE